MVEPALTSADECAELVVVTVSKTAMNETWRCEMAESAVRRATELQTLVK
jgi:hypothetical protein